MDTVRVKIDAPAGLVELEGNRDFVSTYLDKILPLIKAGGFGTKSADPASSNGTAADSAEASSNPEAPKKNSGSPKRVRRAAKRPPAGASCRERILTLRADGFFKEKHSVSDIVGGLGEKGWIHNTNQVSAALMTMFKNDEIRRTRVGNQGFQYFWDRD